MLRLISDIYFREGEPRKLWFTCSEQDLHIWFSERDEIIKFVYSYDKPLNEKSLLWNNSGNNSYTALDIDIGMCCCQKNFPLLYYCTIKHDVKCP